MAIKPILFNTEMVRAILDGRKDATRRIVKGFIPDDAVWGYTAFTPKGYISCRGYGEKFFKLPCEPGDILYVRETWGIRNMDDESKMAYIVYRASEDQENEGCREVHLPDEKFEKMYESMAESKPEWHPSIHMPKEAARIWLKVTDVRVERLQSITEEGAIREGAEGEKCHHINVGAFGCTDCMNTGWIEPPQVGFMQIWNSTIKKSDLDRYGWDANPWVWVIEFERCEKSAESPYAWNDAIHKLTKGV